MARISWRSLPPAADALVSMLAESVVAAAQVLDEHMPVLITC
jgi:hypothetical protein